MFVSEIFKGQKSQVTFLGKQYYSRLFLPCKNCIPRNSDKHSINATIDTALHSQWWWVFVQRTTINFQLFFMEWMVVVGGCLLDTRKYDYHGQELLVKLLICCQSILLIFGGSSSIFLLPQSLRVTEDCARSFHQTNRAITPQHNKKYARALESTVLD